MIGVDATIARICNGFTGKNEFQTEMNYIHCVGNKIFATDGRIAVVFDIEKPISDDDFFFKIDSAIPASAKKLQFINTDFGLACRSVSATFKTKLLTASSCDCKPINIKKLEDCNYSSVGEFGRMNSHVVAKAFSAFPENYTFDLICCDPFDTHIFNVTPPSEVDNVKKITVYVAPRL